MEQLTDILPEPVRAEWKALFEEMEAMETQEARLYKSLDKLEALIQHNEADISTWIPLEYDLQMTYGNEECKFTEYIQRLRDEVRKDSKRKIEEKQTERLIKNFHNSCIGNVILHIHAEPGRMSRLIFYI